MQTDPQRLPPLPGEESYTPRTLAETPDFPVDDDSWEEGEEDFGDMDFGESVPSGRFSETPLPIWSKFHQHEGRANFRLQVQRYNSFGEKEHIGHLPPDASHEALMHLGRRPGKYVVTPVDPANQEVDEPQYISFADDHIFFREHGGMGLPAPVGAASSTVAAATNPSDPTALLTHLDRQEERAQRERERYDAAQQEVLRRAEEQSRSLHETQLEAVRENSQTTAQIFKDSAESERLRQAEVAEQQRVLYEKQELAQQRIHEQELKRNNDASGRMQEQQSGFMAMMMQQMQMIAQQDRERARAQAEQDRMRAEQERLERESRERQDRERWERNMLLEKQSQDNRRAEEKAELARQEERRDRQAREEEQRRQEHMQMMMGMMQQKSENNSPMTGIVTAALAAKPIMDMLGVSPRDLAAMAKSAIAPEPKSGIMSELGETARELIRAAAGGGLPMDPSMFLPVADGGPVAGPAPAQLPETPEPPLLPPPPAPLGMQIPPGMLGNAGGLEGAHPQILKDLPSSEPMNDDSAAIPDRSAPAMQPAEKKQARMALARLVNSFESSGEGDRKMVVGKGFGEDGALFVRFFAEVSVREALRQAGATDTTVEALVTELDSVGLDAAIDRG